MMKTKLSFIALGFYILLILTLVGFPLRAVASQDTPPEAEVLTPLRSEVVNPYFTVETYALADGSLIEKDIISGPPQPPLGFETEREASIVTLTSRSTLANFPSYSWVFGCSAVAGAMIAGFYDRTGYPNMYTGPTNGGIMPLSDTMWGEKWPDCCASGYSYAKNPLVASMQGLDGRTGRGSIENYWFSANSTAPDPYITNSWLQHTWGDAIGDYMKTSQSAWPYESRDGGTWFWSLGDATKLTCAAMETMGVSGETYKLAQVDGTYGRKLFYQARGYTVTDCYNQLTDNQVTGGFSLADYQAQIEAGHPVLLNLVGHSIVGFGYEGSKIYIRDTWSSDPETVYSMTWGKSYQGMDLRSVSVVNLEAPDTDPPSEPTGVIASDGTYYNRVRVSWDASLAASAYKVFRHTQETSADAGELPVQSGTSPYDDFSAIPGETYFYWVKACNSAGCSDYSASAQGRREIGEYLYLPMIFK